MNRDADAEHDGTFQAMVENFVEWRLPTLVDIRDRVDAGELLTDGDIEILSRVIDQAHDFGHAAHEFPEAKPLISKVIELYEHITERGLQNEEESAD